MKFLKLSTSFFHVKVFIHESTCKRLINRTGSTKSLFIYFTSFVLYPYYVIKELSYVTGKQYTPELWKIT